MVWGSIFEISLDIFGAEALYMSMTTTQSNFPEDPSYVQEFWERATERLGKALVYIVMAQDAKRYPELAPGSRVHLLKDEIDGFIHHLVLPPRVNTFFIASA